MPVEKLDHVGDFKTIQEIINDAAQAYKGVIPKDCYNEPYMSQEELREEIASGISFWGYRQEAPQELGKREEEMLAQLVGVMGIQDVKEVTLIRHAYVRTSCQNRGIGSKLLLHLLKQTNRPVLVGTWGDASWAVAFYEKYGFLLITGKAKDELLERYWTIPKRQAEVSVVLADHRWFDTVSRAEKEISQSQESGMIE
jgi:GNAT superfamily N-acetyltransferase